MAQQINFAGQTITVPQSVVQINVQNTVSGLATTGVLMLVGESDQGPSYLSASSPSVLAFGPDQASSVLATYGSGPLVDAFRGAVAAANDPQINGSFSTCYLIKTNVPTSASGLINRTGGGFYGSFYSLSPGAPGNFISYQVSQLTAELVPTTNSFTFLLPIAAANISFRVDGGAEVDYTITTLETPAAFATAVDGLSGLAATGGTARGLLATITGTLAVGLNSATNSVTITRSVAWSASPVVGDTLYIPAGSAIEGAANANCGSYVVTGVTTQTVTATKLMDASGSPGALTAPVAVSATNEAATTDLQGFAPVVISATSVSMVPGKGRSLEINELATNTDRLSNFCYALSPTKVTWVSKAGAPVCLAAAAEYGVTVNTASQTINAQESWNVSGQVAMTMGYAGTTCSVAITDSVLTTTVSGGSGANLSISLANFSSIGNLATYINAQTGYNAAPVTVALGQLNAMYLDNITGNCGTTFGDGTLRVKIDGYDFWQSVNQNSALVQLNNPSIRSEPGLPAVTPLTFLSGGARGGTSNAQFEAAVDYLQAVQGNFLVPLFSQDATADIALGDTDPSSTYTIDLINAYCKTHVLAMSTVKQKKNRQAFLSYEGNFAAQKLAASNISAARCAMTFQDVKDVGLTGIVQYQPWMAAVKAASMQAAGFYRSILNKGINLSGFLQAAGDYQDGNQTMEEQALLAGLLPITMRQDGSVVWLSDQTTYTATDGNFVFNSIQAVYCADTIALTIAQRLQTKFLGQSISDAGAALILSALEGIMFDLLRLKLTAPSDGAEAGFKDAVVRINGPVASVSLSVYLDSALYFIPITLQVQQVTQSASQNSANGS